MRGRVLGSVAAHWKRTEAQLRGGSWVASSAVLLLCVVVCHCVLLLFAAKRHLLLQLVELKALRWDESLLLLPFTASPL